jgi:long-chain fatty acid transport protein
VARRRASSPATPETGGWAAVPNAYLSWALSKDLYLGVGIGAPFGLATEYDDGWVGAAQSIEFEIKTYNINPSIAYRVNDRVSVGLGLNWQRMDARYERALAVVAPALAASHAILDADSNAWGWNIGAMFKLSEATRLGLSYRSAIKHELDGELEIRGPVAGTNPALVSGDAKADVELPDTFILSLAHRLNTRWELLGDLSWTGWSSIEQVAIARASGPLAGMTVQTLDAQFRDTWRLALGATYQYDEAWKFRFGVAYDQSPVRDKERRLVALPDNDRTWVTVGMQWKPDPSSALDVGLAYIHLPNTRIDNNQIDANPALNRGRVTGEYDSSGLLLGLQYSAAF